MIDGIGAYSFPEITMKIKNFPTESYPTSKSEFDSPASPPPKGGKGTSNKGFESKDNVFDSPATGMTGKKGT